MTVIRSQVPLCQANNGWTGANVFASGGGINLQNGYVIVPVAAGPPSTQYTLQIDSADGNALKYHDGSTVKTLVTAAATTIIRAAPVSWSGAGGNTYRNEFGAYGFFPASSTASIAATFAVPPNATATAPIIRWAFGTTSYTGDVYLTLDGRSLKDGDGLGDNTPHATVTVVAMGNQLMETGSDTWNGTWAIDDEWLGITLSREGAQAADTYGGNIYLLGIAVDFEVTS